MSQHSSDQPVIKRRQLLAALGTGAVAGCGSEQPAGSPDDVDGSSENMNQDGCVDASEYEQLREQYQELQDEYDSLRREFQNAQLPPYIVSDRRSVTVTYETLAEEVSSWQWDSATLSAQNSAGNFAREMTYRQLEQINWDVFGFKNRSKYQRLGDFGSYYQLNPFVVPSNFTPLAERLYDRHRTDRERIRAGWHFVTQLNSYVSEIEETPRFPLETLLMGGGDCEDSAILLASILYSMPADLGVKFWYIDIDNPTNPENINHVIVSAETQEGTMLIETTSNEMSPYTEIDGFRVDVEPTNEFGG